MTDHEHAAREFLHSAAWLNAGDIFAQQKAIADFAASLAPLPSDSHKQAAREIVKQTCDAIDVRVAQGDGMAWMADDSGLVMLWAEHIAAALARVERETIERCAKVVESRPGADAYADDNRPCGPCCDLNAAAIRALSGGAK